jgi:hypothetical protein
VPVIYGILTTDSVEQAVDRAGAKSGNRGTDAAQAAVEMANLYGRLPAESGGGDDRSERGGARAKKG